MNMLFGLTKRKETKSDWHRETQTKEKIDWTHFLSSDSVALLRSVLESAYKHRSAYFKSTDIKNAQIWSAMLEMQRQIDELKARINEMSPDDKRVYRKYSPSMAKDEHVKNMIDEATAPSAQDNKEATDSLVNSLMRF